MGIPRNDFTPAPRFESDYCEVAYRETREHFDAMLPPPPLSEADRLAESHYSVWYCQRRDFHSMGHTAYLAKYGAITAPSDCYVPQVVA